MNTAIIITLIICATLIILTALPAKRLNKKDMQHIENYMQTTLNTPKNQTPPQPLTPETLNQINQQTQPKYGQHAK